MMRYMCVNVLYIVIFIVYVFLMSSDVVQSENLILNYRYISSAVRIRNLMRNMKINKTSNQS